LNGTDAGLLGTNLMSNSNNLIVGIGQDDVTVFAHDFDVQVKERWLSRASSKF
jgi:hypothetical protein